jgi:DNA transformation protein and related proteins
MKKKQSDSLQSLPNIGKMTEEKLKKIGIKTAKDFLKRDPYKVFTELLYKVDHTLCRCALASIVGAHKGVPWHKITKETAKIYSKRNPSHKWGKC